MNNDCLIYKASLTLNSYTNYIYVFNYFYTAGCPPLGMEYGHVRISGASFGDTAVFECQPGYKLLGNNVIQCLSDGSWSGVDPCCQGEDIIGA